MAKKNSSNARTMELYRANGWTCEVVEKWHAFARVRKDMLGFIDVLAICPHRGILGLQITMQGEVPAHIKKINDQPNSQVWLRAGGQIELVEWKRKPSKTGNKNFWHYRIWNYTVVGSKITEANKLSPAWQTF